VPALLLARYYLQQLLFVWSLQGHYQREHKLQNQHVTYLAKTQNFVKHDAMSVSTHCSLKVISAIENSILGHNYITSTAKKLFLHRSNSEIATYQNTSQCSHHLLISVYFMYRSHTYFIRVAITSIYLRFQHNVNQHNQHVICAYTFNLHTT
jgi:hypothetical protein